MPGSDPRVEARQRAILEPGERDHELVEDAEGEHPDRGMERVPTEGGTKGMSPIALKPRRSATSRISKMRIASTTVMAPTGRDRTCRIQVQRFHCTSTFSLHVYRTAREKSLTAEGIGSLCEKGLPVATRSPRAPEKRHVVQQLAEPMATHCGGLATKVTGR